jgi:hypothetical protein
MSPYSSSAGSRGLKRPVSGIVEYAADETVVGGEVFIGNAFNTGINPACTPDPGLGDVNRLSFTWSAMA